MQRKNRRRIVLVTIVFAVIFISLLFLLMFLQASKNILGFESINATVKVGDYVGINLNQDKLNFGTVMPGGSANRAININSTTEGYIYVVSRQDASDWLYIEKTSMKIDAGSQFQLMFIARPKTAEQNTTLEAEVKVFVLNNKPNFIVKSRIGGYPVLTADIGETSSPKIELNITGTDEKHSNI